MSGILLASVGNSYGSAPVNTVAPAVTGTATFGSTLTTTNGTWTGAPAPTFTYQWQRVTTNISGATSSTYVLVAADVGNTIRCVVTATNPLAPSGVTANSNSTASVTVPAIGAALGGGYYAGQISTTANGVATDYLVVAPKASGQSNKQWYPAYALVAGTNNAIDGPTNTANLFATGNSQAANFVDALTIGGFTDWYMPARYELEAMYYNLKPTTQSNNTSTGNNSYSVPQRNSNYTAGDPAQTSATLFQNSNSEAFDIVSYWSSTESGANTAFEIYFGNGTSPNNNSKLNANATRAVRRIPV